MRVNIDISDTELYFKITTYHIFIYINSQWINRTEILSVFLFWRSCQIFLTLKDCSRMWRMKAREKNDAIENHMSLKGKYSALMLYTASS